MGSDITACAETRYPMWSDDSSDDDYKVEMVNGKVHVKVKGVSRPPIRTSVPGVRRPAGSSASSSPSNTSGATASVYTDIRSYAKRGSSSKVAGSSDEQEPAAAPVPSKYRSSFSLKDVQGGGSKSAAAASQQSASRPTAKVTRPAPISAARSAAASASKTGQYASRYSPTAKAYEKPEIQVTKRSTSAASYSRSASNSPKPSTSPTPSASPKTVSRGAAYASASPSLHSPTSNASMSPTSPIASPGSPKKKAARVVLWDLDDTLILWDSLKSKYSTIPCSSSCGISEGTGSEIFDQLLPLSKEFQEDYLDQLQVSSLQADELSAGTARTPVHTLASNSRYHNVIELFDQRCSDLLHGSDLEKERQKLLRRIEQTSKGWLSAGKQAAAAFHAHEGTVNVVITASRVMAAVSKMLLFDLNSSFDSSNIYSCWMRGKKLDAFRHVQRMYPHAKFMAVGDGNQERDAAQELGIPFVRIANLKDIQGVVNRV